MCKSNEKCNDDGECVKRSCIEEPDLCKDTEKCNAEGNCVASCYLDSTLCSQDAQCSPENECIKKNEPEFCEAPEMDEFFIKHFDLIKKASTGEDFQASCKAESELTDVFTNEGPAVCSKVAHCVTGSVKTFFACASNFIQRVYNNKVQLPEPHTKDGIDFQSVLMLSYVSKNRSNCWACGAEGNYCDVNSQKCAQNACVSLCDNNEAMCGDNAICDKETKECMELDEKGAATIYPA